MQCFIIVDVYYFVGNEKKNAAGELQFIMDFHQLNVIGDCGFVSSVGGCVKLFCGYPNFDDDVWGNGGFVVVDLSIIGNEFISGYGNKKSSSKGGIN